MVRKCSHCGNTGHNSRTCTINNPSNPNNLHTCSSFRLFGVHLHISNSNSNSNPMIKKSLSLDCFPSSSNSPTPSSTSSLGYLSDGLLPSPCPPDLRKKGVPWSEDEHRNFLIGLEKLGKGDWRGISRHFVTTRTPTQVASHAQKYFLRQACIDKKRRRASLFDMVGGGSDNADTSQTPFSTSSNSPGFSIDLNDASNGVDCTNWTSSNNNKPSHRHQQQHIELELALSSSSSSSPSSANTVARIGGPIISVT